MAGLGETSNLESEREQTFFPSPLRESHLTK